MGYQRSISHMIRRSEERRVLAWQTGIWGLQTCEHNILQGSLNRVNDDYKITTDATKLFLSECLSLRSFEVWFSSEDRALIYPALLNQVSSRLVSCQHRHGPQWENFTQAVIFSESQAMSRLEPLLHLTHPTTTFVSQDLLSTLDEHGFSDWVRQYYLAFKIDIQWALDHSWFVRPCS